MTLHTWTAKMQLKIGLPSRLLQTLMRRTRKGLRILPLEIPSAEEDVKAKLADSLSKIRMMETQEITLPVIPEERELLESKCCAREHAAADAMPSKHTSTIDVEVQSYRKIGLCSV